MSNTKVDAAAAQWLIELETADRIEQLWPDFQVWLAQDPRHRAAFLRVEEAGRRLDALRYLRPSGKAVNPDLLSEMLDASERRRAPWVDRCIRWVSGTASSLLSTARALRAEGQKRVSRDEGKPPSSP